MTTIRKQIIDAVKTQLETITVTGGYNYNIGDYVRIAERLHDPDVEIGAVIWPEIDKPDDDGGFYSRWSFVTPLRILAFKKINSSIDFESVSQMLLADIAKCMHGMPETKADVITFTGGGCEAYPEPGETHIGAVGIYDIYYHTVAGDLESQ